jgi:hypothetical protein
VVAVVCSIMSDTWIAVIQLSYPTIAIRLLRAAWHSIHLVFVAVPSSNALHGFVECRVQLFCQHSHFQAGSLLVASSIIREILPTRNLFAIRLPITGIFNCGCGCLPNYVGYSILHYLAVVSNDCHQIVASSMALDSSCICRRAIVERFAWI